MKRITATLLLMVVIIFSGCKPTETSLLDRAGNSFEMPKKVEKIISMSPSCTEIIVALGLADKLVAVDVNSIGLEGVPQNLIAFDMLTPDAELLASVQADLVVVNTISTGQGSDPFAQLKQQGSTVVYIQDSKSIEGIYEDILFLGTVTSKKQVADQMVNDMKKQFSNIVELAKKVTVKKTVFFEISAAPEIYSFGSGVFLNELIEVVGATNIFASQTGWLPASAEAVVAANPDVIFTNVGYIEEPVAEILARSGFSQVTAVVSNQVYKIDTNASTLPTHNVVKAAYQMGEYLYPEIFKGSN